MPENRFLSALEPAARRAGPALWFAFLGSDLLVLEAEGAADVPLLADLGELGLEPVRSQFLGSLGGHECWSVELAGDATAPSAAAFRPLRALYGLLPEDLYAVAGRAAQIVEWERTHLFCGRCGGPTEPAPGERARRCPACGLASFPRLSPAVIMRVERGEELLLARAHSFPDAFYSVLAGFVEPGESLEEAVAREIEEEVGIEVGDVRYFGSQPWPYPHSLMIGFTAAYAGGEIRIDERELLDAAWFTADRLPRVPPPLSIARWLIDDFVSRFEG